MLVLSLHLCLDFLLPSPPLSSFSNQNIISISNLSLECNIPCPYFILSIKL
jgi:hypothetical protein